MKKKLTAAALLAVLLLTLAGCMPSREPLDAAFVGRYDLIELSGSQYLSVDSYEYSYIELTADGGYRIENKAAGTGTVTTQEGAAFVEGSALTLFTDLGFFRVTEEHYEIEGNRISMKDVKATEDGEIVYLTFVFEKN